MDVSLTGPGVKGLVSSVLLLGPVGNLKRRGLVRGLLVTDSISPTGVGVLVLLPPPLLSNHKASAWLLLTHLPFCVASSLILNSEAETFQTVSQNSSFFFPSTH